jgi:hypothetical protein
MITLHDKGVYWRNGAPQKPLTVEAPAADLPRGKRPSPIPFCAGTTAPAAGHPADPLRQPDLHDITYVGIIQTAKASGLTHFPSPTC